MEHLDVKTVLDLIGYLLGLIGAVTTSFCGILIWVSNKVSTKFDGMQTDFSEKLDKIADSVSKLNETVVQIKDEFNEKHAIHDTKIAVIQTQLDNAVERRKN